jgi:DNA-binding NtrC family response regulator
MRTVLSVNKDPAVLSTRNAVLASAGYAIRPCTDVEEALELCASRRFDIAVIGDCITFEQRLQLARELRELCPQMTIVMICRPYETCRKGEDADEVVGSLDGPEALLRAIDAAIGQRSASEEA